MYYNDNYLTTAAAAGATATAAATTATRMVGLVKEVIKGTPCSPKKTAQRDVLLLHPST